MCEPDLTSFLHPQCKLGCAVNQQPPPHSEPGSWPRAGLPGERAALSEAAVVKIIQRNVPRLLLTLQQLSKHMCM